MMKILSYLFIAVGAVFLVYGGWQWYSNTHQVDRALAKAEKLVSNASLKQSLPTAQDEHKNGKHNMNQQYKGDDVIGLIEIPRLNRKLPIVEGTDLTQLKKGVGHYSTTALPGKHDQILLAGHRDTVFKGLGQLKKGDEIIVKMPYGTYKYAMAFSKIVGSDDRSIIHPTAPKETLVLATCYPFMFVGNAPDRYILYANPIETNN